MDSRLILIGTNFIMSQMQALDSARHLYKESPVVACLSTIQPLSQAYSVISKLECSLWQWAESALEFAMLPAEHMHARVHALMVE